MNSKCSCRKHAPDFLCPRHSRVTEDQFKLLSEQPTIVTLVIDDLREREEYGTAQYGVPLLEDSSKENALREAYEEALDLCVYLRLELSRRSV